MAGEPFIRLLNRAKSSRRLSVPIPGIIDKQRHLSLMYQPPFSISSAAVNLIAEISALVERYAIRLEQSGGLRLRKAVFHRFFREGIFFRFRLTFRKSRYHFIQFVRFPLDNCCRRAHCLI